MRLTIHRSNVQSSAKNCIYDVKCLIENMEQLKRQYVLIMYVLILKIIIEIKINFLGV